MTRPDMFRTGHGDGASTPTPVTIWGCHAGDVWVERDGDFTALTPRDLTEMTNRVRKAGTVLWAGIRWDESDVIELVKAQRGPQLDDCADCDGPGLVVIEGRAMCPGHLAGFGAREESA